MRKSRHDGELISAALRQAEIETPIAEITRKLGVPETSCLWKRRLCSLGIPEIREWRQLHDENAKLEQAVAD